uniref:Thioredoxin-2 n=1 Tax=Cacopsylla melanoneura TaxID=428564 RepID=A0A8D8Y8D2_9HEMI
MRSFMSNLVESVFVSMCFLIVTSQAKVHDVTGLTSLNTKLTEAGNDKLVVVYFHANWCGPCKTIKPQIVDLAEEVPDVEFFKVNVDENEDIAKEYQISNLPTFVFLKASKKVDQFSGANFDKLKSTVTTHRESPVKK